MPAVLVCLKLDLRFVCEILFLPNVKLCKLPTSALNGLKVVAGVVRKLGNAIQWINHYSVDSGVRFVNTYSLDSDFSC